MIDQRVVITGGLGRIGRVLTKTLAAQGISVIVTSRSKSKVAEFNRGPLAANVYAERLAFSSDAEIGRFVAELEQKYGPVTGLVNNAYAAMAEKNLEDISLDDWSFVARVDLGGAVSLAKCFVGNSEKSNLNSVVNVSSIYGIMAPDFSIYTDERIPSMITYGAMKAGLIQISRYLAVYWADRGVRVNAVALGGVEAGQTAKFQDAYGRLVPQKRMIDAQEAADTIAFLLSPAASGITGENVVVDAGRHAW